MEGYELRHSILRQQAKIGIPSLIHNYQKSWNDVKHDYPRPHTKEGLGYMFYLAVENCRESNYFTEKLIRSFAAMCVPIYFGDPSITDEFDPDGIILINESNWLEVINNLTPADYYDRLDAVRRNYFLSEKYWGKTARISRIAGNLRHTNQTKNGLVISSKCPLICTIKATLIQVGNNQYHIIDKENNTLTEMNDTAALVFSLIDGNNTACSIATQICASIENSDQDEIRDDVANIISHLIREGIIRYHFSQLDIASLTAKAGYGVTLNQVGDQYELENVSGRVQINPSTALIVSLCDGKKTLRELLQTISTQVQQPVKAIEKDAICTIFRLVDKGYLNTERLTETPVIQSPRHINQESSKPRILFLLTRYPQLSETYIKNEIEALKHDYEIKVISFESSNLRFKNQYPYEIIKVKGNTMSDEIVDEDGKLRHAIEAFRPDILHTHYLNNARLVSTLSRLCNVPFTLRAHSYDVLHSSWRVHGTSGEYQPSRVARNAVDAINGDNCLGIRTFPYTVDALKLAGVKSKKIRACYPVVDFARFDNRDENEKGLLNVEPCLPKKAVTDFIDLALLAPSYRYSLYGMGHQIKKVTQYNADRNFPVRIFDPLEPEEMPGVYKSHNWLIYTANFKSGNMGWPLAVFEAQAAGMGICIANIHPATADQLGGAGYIYNAIEEIPKIIAEPYPDDMRERGFTNARLADIQRHKYVLTELWDQVIA